MAVNITYPVDSTTYGTNWTGTLTGTASAATGTTISLSGVKVSVQQGSGSSSCWTGSGANFTAACPNYVAVATYSSPNWTLGLPASDLTSGDTYHVTAQATDSLSVSATSTTVSFTYTVPPPIAVAPTATATTFVQHEPDLVQPRERDPHRRDPVAQWRPSRLLGHLLLLPDLERIVH